MARRGAAHLSVQVSIWASCASIIRRPIPPSVQIQKQVWSGMTSSTVPLTVSYPTRRVTWLPEVGMPGFKIDGEPVGTGLLVRFIMVSPKVSSFTVGE